MLQYLFSSRQFRLEKCSFFSHSPTPYIHPRVVMGDTMGSLFIKPEKNLEFFRLKNDPMDVYPGKLE